MSRTNCLINLKHLSIDLGDAKPKKKYDLASLRSLVNLRSLSILNSNSRNSTNETLLIRHLDARNGNGRLITMNDMNVNELLLTSISYMGD
jgi:hypothetical protein